MIDAQVISEGLGGERAGQGYLACCPAHDDRHPSLSINDGDDGKPLVHCFVGCSQKEVIAALTERGLWPEKDGITLSQAELDALRERSARLKAEREAEKLKQEEQAATKARKRWEATPPANQTHQYLAKKNIMPHGIRQDGDKLIVPLRDESGIIWALQTIDLEGGKFFFPKGCRTKGLYFSIGQPAPGGPVCILEGLATGAAIHEGTGHPVACAMTDRNLAAVARIVKGKLPGNQIVVCADDDLKPDTDHNPGIEAATWAARVVGGVVAVPALGRKADFWDLWSEQGADAVRQAIEGAVRNKLVRSEVRSADAPAVDQVSVQDIEIETQDWPVIDQAAFHGLAGDFVRLACRSSEADPAAVLATFLVRFAVECGRAPTLYVGDTKHHTRLAAVVVGASSKARKGTSAKPVARLFSDMEWLAHSSPGPFSSGEGIIYAVRDEVQRFDEKNGGMVTVDPGVLDKRLFVMDEEFAGALASTKREGNTLSMVIRCAWDDGTFDPLTKTNKIKATRAHVGWVSHITIDELHRKLGESEAFNGFANRILWVCARRSKLTPFPEPMPDDELAAIRQRLVAALEPTRGVESLQVRWGAAAMSAWSGIHYQRLTQEHPGLGCVVNRAEAQVLRLAMIYCLLDGGTVIEEIHLNAALAFWSYCEQSARYVFHGRMEDTTAQTILEAVRERDFTGADIHALFGNNLSKARLGDALSCLIAAGRITKETVKQKKGRPTTVYRFRQMSYEKNELSPPNHGHEPFNSFNSLSNDVKTGLVEVEI